MPDLDLEPSEYREKRRLIYRITHASRRDLLIATVIGAWVGVGPGLRAIHVEPFESLPGIVVFAIAVVPAAIYWLWLMFFAD